MTELTTKPLETQANYSHLQPKEDSQLIDEFTEDFSEEDPIREIILTLELARQMIPYQVSDAIVTDVYCLLTTASLDAFLGGIIEKADNFNSNFPNGSPLEGYSLIIGFLAGFMTAIALRRDGEPVREYMLEKLRTALAE